MRFLTIIFFVSQFLLSLILTAQVSKITISKSPSGFKLLKNSQPYYIKGAGAKNNFKKVKESGGNSIRIWSTNRSQLLDSALKYDLS